MKYIYVLFLIVAITIFILNYNHIGQQGVYKDVYMPLSKDLIENYSYTLSGKDVLYPMPGYPVLLAFGTIIGNVDIYILFVQVILSIIGLYYLYKLFEVKEEYCHIILLIPYFAFMSVKWPGAIILFLLIMFLYTFKNYLSNGNLIQLTTSGILFGLMCNFRSDYFMFLIFMFITTTLFYAFITKWFDCKRVFIGSITVMIITLLLLTPWAIYSYNYDGHIRFTSTNSGGVLYISLGQLPNNPWGIKYQDKDAYDYVSDYNINSPWYPESDILLKNAFLSNVYSHPYSYLSKVMYILFKSFIGGVYIGEYYTLFSSKDRTQQLVDIKNHEGLYSVFDNMNLNEIVIYLLYYLIRLLYCLLFFIIILFSFYYLYTDVFTNVTDLFLFIIFIFIIYNLLLVSFIQYEPRHMNIFYTISCFYLLHKLNNTKSP